MAERKIRIGFVGVGGMGQCAHLKNYATLPACEVVALAEVKKELGKKVAERYGVPRVYCDAGDMIAQEQGRLDGIVASQPFNRHGILVPELLKAGVPIFTEKPIAASIQVGERIVAAVKQSGTWHMVGYHKRSDPAVMAAKAEIERIKGSGELGKLQYVRLLMPAGDWVAGGFNDLMGTNDPNPSFAWDSSAPDMEAETFKQYTAFVNYYIHQVNLLRHLLGEPYVPKFADRAGMLLVGESQSGITCSIEMSPYQTTLDWQESALVCFEKGWVRIELPAPLAANRPGRVVIFKDHPAGGIAPHTVIPQLPWMHAMRQQAMNFLAAIRDKTPPLTDAAEALEDLRVAREYIRLRYGK